MRAADYVDLLHLESVTIEFVTHRPVLHSGPSMQIECDLSTGDDGQVRALGCFDQRDHFCSSYQPNILGAHPSNKMPLVGSILHRWIDLIILSSEQMR